MATKKTTTAKARKAKPDQRSIDAVKEAVESGREVFGGTKPGDERLSEKDLPRELRSEVMVGVLNDAIENSTVPTKFPERESYPVAFQPKHVADALIESGLHEHLSEARIAYVYRDGLSKDGATANAKISKTGAKWRELACIDFVVEVNYQTWPNLTRAERVRTIDHELEHVAEETDPETGTEKLVMRSHDVEEFVSIIRRWGIARGQARFAEAIVAAQRDLFDPPSA